MEKSMLRGYSTVVTFQLTSGRLVTAPNLFVYSMPFSLPTVRNAAWRAESRFSWWPESGRAGGAGDAVLLVYWLSPAFPFFLFRVGHECRILPPITGLPVVVVGQFQTRCIRLMNP